MPENLENHGVEEGETGLVISVAVWDLNDRNEDGDPHVYHEVEAMPRKSIEDAYYMGLIDRVRRRVRGDILDANEGDILPLES